MEDKNNNKNNDFVYTLVMDESYKGPASVTSDTKLEEMINFTPGAVADIDAQNEPGQEEDRRKKEAEKAEANKAAVERMKAIERRELIDRLYYEYEKMCLKEPTVLDTDDAYPHSYQWRIADRYEESKVLALEEALKNKIRIADTEAYQKFLEDVKSRKYSPVSWDV